MARKVRRVPPDWRHPKNAQGHYIPMYETFPYDEDEIAEGLADGWLDASKPDYGVDVMPQWPDEERTHLQMYEDTTEGTPISPVMATPEELARWLADNYTSWYGRDAAEYEDWLRLCVPYEEQH